MKVIRILKITCHEFYDYLENELLNDINQQTRQAVNKADIKKGLKYHKYAQDVNARVDITIQQYIRNQIYEAKIKTLSESIIITYRTQVVNDGLKVIFTEHVHSFESQKRNHINQSFHEIMYLRRMTNTLYEIETNILKKRDGIETLKPKSTVDHKYLYKIFTKNKS